jgi:glycosyltransferase involved in cell wall biosynthesis
METTDNAMRVLCVFSSLDRGGAETMCMNLYRNIDRNRIQFDFVKHISRKCAYEDEIMQMGGRIYEAPRFKLYNYYSYKKWWMDFLENHTEYKIIHGHFFTISSFYFKFAKKNGLITVAHSHSSNVPLNSIKKLLTRVLELNIEKKADYCLACSNEAGKYLFPHSKYIVLKNAIDISLYENNRNVREEYRRTLNIESKKVFIHIGRISEEKNHLFLLEVFNKTLKSMPNAFLLLVGVGELKEVIEKKIKELGIEDYVNMLGVRNDVSNLLQAADCFLFPSKWEGLPVSVVEAQAAGLPCLISNKITEEVKISSLVHTLSIDDGVENWVKEIETLDYQRKNVIDDIRNAGYDIHHTAKWLEDFYEKIANEKK